MSWDIIFQADTLAMYGRGLIVTLSLLLSSLATGGILALLCALALTSGYTVLEKVVGAFTYFVRGTPLLIQVYLIYYGLGQLEWIQARSGEQRETLMALGNQNHPAMEAAPGTYVHIR